MKSLLTFSLLMGLLLLIGVMAIPAGSVLADSLYESYTSGDDDNGVINSNIKLLAQTFKAESSHSITSVRLKLSRVLTPGTITISIRKTDVSGHPTGDDLVSKTLDGNSLTTATDGQWYQIDFDNPYALFDDTVYAIVITAPSADSSNRLRWRLDKDLSVYDNGRFERSDDSGASWTFSSTYVQDAMFEVYGNLITEVWVDDDWSIYNPGDSVSGHIFGYDAFATIQDGIDAVTGSTVHVAAGHYNPTTTIMADKDNLLLEGPQANIDPRPSAASSRTAGSASEAIIDGTTGNLGTVISIDADNVTINGFEVKSGTDDIIYQDTYHSNTMVTYCIVHDGNGDDGIQLKRSTNGVLEYNYVFDIVKPGDALSIADESTNGSIRFNEAQTIITGNAAIHVYGSDNIEIVSNLVDTVIEGKIKGSGIRVGNKDGSEYNRSGGLINVQNNIIRNIAGSGIQVFTSNVNIAGNDITNCGSDDGAIYVKYEVTNVEILSNNIHDNVLSTATRLTSAGIFIESTVDVGHIFIHFNNIYNNQPYGLTNESASLLNAENNWWGANDGPNASPGSGDSIWGNVDYDPWLVIGISADPPSILIDGATSLIKADMTINSDGVDTSLQGHIPDGTQIVFTTTEGSIGSSQTTKLTTDGQAQATLTSSGNVVVATVSAKAPGHIEQSEVSTDVNFYAESDLALSKSASPDPVLTGNNLTYVISIVNAGPSNAPDVVVTDILPPDTTFVSADTYGKGTYNSSTGQWAVGNLDVQEMANLTLVIKINLSVEDGTILTNTAQITGNVVDPDSTNNTSSTDTTVNAPDIQFNKTATLIGDEDGNGVASPGDIIKYTATLENSGSQAAVGVFFFDSPDINTTIVKGSVTTSQGIIQEGNWPDDSYVKIWLGTIPVHGLATVTFNVTINKPLWEIQIKNQAILTGDNLPTLKSDNPNTLVLNDPTIMNIQTSPSLPGVTFWGSVILATLLCGTIIWVIRRKIVTGETNQS